MQDDLIGFPGYALRRAALATMADLAARLAPLGLRQVDSSAMLLIRGNPGITASALGRALDVQRANMVPLLKKLEDSGWVARAPIDGKSQGLTLTPEGAAKLAEAMAVIEAFEADLLARVPQEHRAHLLPALNSLWR